MRTGIFLTVLSGAVFPLAEEMLRLITIVAAVVTPTPDIVNLMLLAVPRYLLFELGILGIWLCERRRQSALVMDSIAA